MAKIQPFDYYSSRKFLVILQVLSYLSLNECCPVSNSCKSF